jgi:hypothetical protein
MSFGLVLATAVACVLLCVHASCGEGGVGDTWCNPAPTALVVGRDGRATEFAVVSAHLVEAEKKLETAAILPLAEADLGYYGVGAREVATHVHPYLVRGLMGFEGTGRFDVGQYEDTLVVVHASLGSYMPRAKRSPLVVWLPNEPRQVYVEISIAK